MSINATTGRSRRTARRLRAIRERLAAWRRRARRSATLALVTAGMSLAALPAGAQMGQTAMAPTGGLVNRAVNGLRDLNQNGPGIFYYGINAADRGLGYLGSYMTVGGFVPVAEDDLGGFWAADLRGHLSEYGGFFSNVGAVRKQFIGGTLLGVGVYWDYDGDLNQYPETVIPSVGRSYVFPGGQVYNQVGISGEWLTDYGNLRSNGYIPVGQTGELAGPFVGNSILCVNGVNAALGGADLEVGAYVPSLADWAGMISVGGYALGNTRYQFANGQAAVPWFGGVYTRLDMTFIENWDFSLQYNNDSYFDSTGFARLTYRMGGSRRRNVPDQVEQPLMRNEHIVRAHQAPEVATNPDNLDAAGNPLPWQVFHVDNSAAAGGNGTAEAPFQTLAQAEATAMTAYDIVYVAVGNSLAQPYPTPAAGYTFAAANQRLVGEGSTLLLPTVTCGMAEVFTGDGSGLYPVITNPSGPAVVIDQPGTQVSHLRIVSSPVGISDGGGLAAPRTARVSDLIIDRGAAPLSRGVSITNSDGRFLFDRITLNDLNNDGFVISATSADVAITNSQLNNTVGAGLLASGAASTTVVQDTNFTGTVGTAIDSSGAASEVNITNGTVSDTIGDALVASGPGARIAASGVAINDTQGSALVASGNDAAIRGIGLRIEDTLDDAVAVTGSRASVVLDSSVVDATGGFGGLVTGENSGLYLTNGSVIQAAESDGLHILGEAATVLVEDSSILNSGVRGIYVDGRSPLFSTSGTTQVTVLRSVVGSSTGVGILAENVNAVVPTNPLAGGVVQIFSSRVISTAGGGVVANSSNIDIGRTPNEAGSPGTVISDTGGLGVAMNDQSRLRIRNSQISGVGTGIAVTGSVLGGDFSNLIATSNTISASGAGVSVVANHGDGNPPPPDFTNINLAANNISSGTENADIELTTTNVPDPYVLQPIGVANAADAGQLGSFNIGATVVEDPGNPGLTAYLNRTLPQPVGPIITLPPPTPLVPAPPQ